ncbi:MAG: beta-glucosidase BglX [Bacteroidetes bacterium]|nr:beta-glucosidase BglX [Bacteroidota bacterium]MBS1930288.1 beta-glucosidase BglX [Bacteroidota bacterium]
MRIVQKLIPGLLILCMLRANAQNTQEVKMKSFIDALMKKMTLEEKIGQLNLLTIGVDVTGPILSKDVEQKIKRGYVGAILNTHGPAAVRKLQEMAVKDTRLGIPMLFGLDVIHGHTTMFPIPLGLASSWNPDLIQHTARIAAIESAADGINWTYSPMVDIARDPRWGRIAEGAGEDPYLGSLIAKSMVKGYQGNNLADKTSILACVKHFALYGAAEGGRDYNTVDMSKVRMYNIYLPPYKAAIEAGVGSVMTSFNEIDGIPATGNKWLLTDVLRKQWGFKGFVVTDYTAINEMMEHGMGDSAKVTELALKAGVDMDMVSEAFVDHLQKLINEKRITQTEINTACRRVLESKFKLGLFDDPYKNLDDPDYKEKILTPENRAYARKAAEESMVLLKNENNLLPLKKSQTIALIGPLADNKQDITGPHGAASNIKNNISVMEGFTQAGVHFLFAKGANITDDTLLLKELNANGGNITVDKKNPQQLIEDAVNTANKADVIVAVLGESQGMSGEAASRSEIGLPQSQEDLLKALVATGKPVVLVLMNGRPLTLDWENKNVTAILETWFAGTEAGNAITDILWGNVNPSGKLTVSFPVNVGQIPIYYNHKNTGRPYKGDILFKYTSRYLDVSNDPLFPFGFGLSYTNFNYSDIKLSKNILTTTGKITATVTVTNTGNYDGAEVVQMYIREMTGTITRPVRELKGFQKIFLKKGESKNVNFTLDVNTLKFYNSDLKYVAEPGNFKIFIGGSSDATHEASFILK